MDRPVPTLTRYPCNARTKLAFSPGVRVRTVFEAVDVGELNSALLPQTATLSAAFSPGASRTAATDSRFTRRPALNARLSTGVVNA